MSSSLTVAVLSSALLFGNAFHFKSATTPKVAMPISRTVPVSSTSLNVIGPFKGLFKGPSDGKDEPDFFNRAGPWDEPDLDSLMTANKVIIIFIL